MAHTTSATEYRTKALETEDRALRTGYLVMAKATADGNNPVLPLLAALSQDQLRDVLNAVLELLPSDDNDSGDTDSTLWS